LHFLKIIDVEYDIEVVIRLYVNKGKKIPSHDGGSYEGQNFQYH